MKRLLAILLTGLVVGGCAAIANNATSAPEEIVVFSDNQYTYDGEYDPDVLMNWDVATDTNNQPLGESWVDDGINYSLFFMENPDINDFVKQIVVVITINNKGVWQLVSYGYSKYGIDYVFVLDYASNHYKLWMERPSSGNIHYL